MKEKIIALVSVYFPDESNIANIIKICDQVDSCYVCDNSPNATDKFSSLSKCQYLFNGGNLGLSLAFNKVLKSDGFRDDDFIIFFDQDSTIGDGYIKSLVCEYDKLTKQVLKIGGIGPNFYNSYSSKENTLLDEKTNVEPIKVDTLMTSSFLCKYSTLKDVCFWNEDIFLDLSDWDLCWRLKEKGFSCFIIPHIILKHTLGKGEKKRAFIHIKEGSPFRVYYQTRDCLRLITKKYVPVKSKLRFSLMLTIRPIIYLLFLGNKRERIKYFLKGIHDYQKGIRGSL